MPINKEYVPIDNQPTIKPRTVTGIFTRYIAKTLPLAFDESMSYYECLCALLEYLNETIVPDINNANEGLEELQTFYEELQTYVNDYFKNLDVQEEINNKLDDMAESGELTDIIAQYLGLAGMIAFDTVADMKEATNLVNGSKCHTLGYFSVNDTGSAVYKIRTITNNDVVDEATIISLYNESLVAELIPSIEISSVTLGDTEESLTDESDHIQLMFNYTEENKLKLKLRKNKTYNIGDHIKINSDLYVDFNGSTFKMNDNTLSEFLYNMDNITTQSYVVKNITLINGTFDGNNEHNVTGNLTGMCVCLYNGDNFKVDNFTIKNCQRNCFNIYETSNISLTNLTFRNISTESPANIVASSCITIYNRIDEAAMPRRGDNVIIENIDVDDYAWGILFFLGVNNISVKNLKGTNGMIGSGIYSIPITVTECEYLTFDNIYLDTTSTVAFEINQNTKYLTANNVKITNAYQCVTLGPNTKNDSINQYIKFTNCYFNPSGYYFLSINNTNDIIFENCKNTSSGIASSYTLIKNIIFKNCELTIDFTRFYIAQACSMQDCVINGAIIHSLIPIIKQGNADNFCKLDAELPYSLVDSSSTTVDLPINLVSYYGFVGHLDVTSFRNDNSYYEYIGTYLYKTSVNSGDTGTISSELANVGNSSYKVTPAVGTRGKIALSRTAENALKGFVHIYN